jgi:hypothetical protein
VLGRWFLAELIFSAMKMETKCSSETPVDNGLHGIISQKMVLFITTGEKTSNPKVRFFSECHDSKVDTNNSTRFIVPYLIALVKKHTGDMWEQEAEGEGEEVTENWRQLHSEKLYNLYSTTIIK